MITLLLSLMMYSQDNNENISISGKVIDANTKMPIEFATISFNNGTELVGTTTNKKGDFSIQIQPNIYTIKFEFLSYKPHISPQKKLDIDIDLGLIELFYSAELLEEVKLKSQNQLTEFKVNKKIYRSSKDIANYGGNAIDVLNNAPSVKIDAEGNVSMRGNSATILIDGKPVFGLDNGMDMLSAMPSNAIEKVEIITRSAKYSAEGGGILNIITKKRKGLGLSGSLDIHAGTPDNNGASVFLNENTDYINLFSTISFNNEKKIKRTTIDQTYFDDAEYSIGIFEQNRKDKNQRNSFLFNIGSDFYIDNKNTITASFLINTSNKNFISNLDLNDFAPELTSANSILQSSNREVSDFDDISKIETFLNYTNTFDENGQQLSFDFKYNTTISENNADIIENTILPNNASIHQKVAKNQNLDNFLLQLDYALPFKEDKMLELGYKSTLRYYKNAFKVTQFDDVLRDFIVVGGFTDVVQYDEKIHAFYAQYTATHGSFSYVLGLRSEISDVSVGTRSNNPIAKNYTDFFPSATLAYEFDNGSYLSLDYSRSIDRPKISQINPFISFNDERFQSVGNPELNPFYTHYFELLYDMDFEKLLVTSSVYTNYAENQFLTVIQPAGQNADGLATFKRTPINSGNRTTIGVDIDMTYTPFKGLRLNTYVSPYREETSNALDHTYNSSNTVLYAEASALVSLNNGLRFKAQHVYQSPIIEGLAKYKPINFTNITISKSIFKKKAMLTFKALDVFNTKWFSSRSLEANTNTYRRVRFDRQFSLAFTYQFKQERKSIKDRSNEVNKDVLEDKQDQKL